MYGNGTGTWTNSEFGMIHLLYFTYLTQCFVKQLVHSLFFYNLFSVSPSWCFAFFPFWYGLCHYHSLFLCSWHVFHIYFSYSETFLSYILVLYTRIKMFPHPGGSLYSCHCRDQEAASGLPHQITSAMWGFFLIRCLCPSSVTIYLPTLFLLHLLDLAYYLAPWYSNDSPFSHY